MRNLVRRYVTVEQRKTEREGVTEDDVNEIKQDISAFRCELIEILKNSGMNTMTASGSGSGETFVVLVQFFSVIFFLSFCMVFFGVFPLFLILLPHVSLVEE